MISVLDIRSLDDMVILDIGKEVIFSSDLCYVHILIYIEYNLYTLGYIQLHTFLFKLQSAKYTPNITACTNTKTHQSSMRPNIGSKRKRSRSRRINKCGAEGGMGRGAA